MDAPHTLDAAIFAHAAAHPAKTAVIDGTTHIDYAQLVARASAVANALDAQGVPPGSLVGVCMHRDWRLVATLLGVLDRLLDDHRDRIEPGELADAYLAVVPMRLSSRDTIRRLAAGESPGPEVSVDKVLLARAELAVHDLARDARSPALELGDDDDDDVWRQDYLYSRPAPIYGGSIEIQRTILADRVLGLPRAE